MTAKRSALMSLPAELDTPLDEFIEKLELYKGRWAIEIRGQLYVFPQETTRKQAEEVLRRAYDIYSGKGAN